MARPPRIQYPDASYHVFNRGNRREVIFRDEVDYLAFETYTLEAMTRSGIILYNWSQMPNHFHFNLMTPEGNLAEFMQRLLSRYSRHFNVTYRLVGHLFQSRYGSRLVDKDAYFKELIRYVELNPYRVKTGPLAPLGQWRWSSLHYLLQPEEAWPEGCRRAFNDVLDAFHSDRLLSRQALTTFLADGLQSGTWQDFYKPRAGRFLGNDAFIERAKALNDEPVRTLARRYSGSIRFEEILDAAQKVSGMTSDRLLSISKERDLSTWRQSMIYIARRAFRIPVVELAKRFACAESTISMTMRRLPPEIDDQPPVRKILAALQLPQM